MNNVDGNLHRNEGKRHGVYVIDVKAGNVKTMSIIVSTRQRLRPEPYLRARYIFLWAGAGASVMRT